MSAHQEFEVDDRVTFQDGVGARVQGVVLRVHPDRRYEFTYDVLLDDGVLEEYVSQDDLWPA